MTRAYHALLAAIELRRCQVGISMEVLNIIAGDAERSFVKGLFPDARSGRVAGWAKIEQWLTALFPAGYVIEIREPSKAEKARPGLVKLFEDAKGAGQRVSWFCSDLRRRGWVVIPPLRPTNDEMQAAAKLLRRHGWACVDPREFGDVDVSEFEDCAA